MCDSLQYFLFNLFYFLKNVGYDLLIPWPSSGLQFVVWNILSCAINSFCLEFWLYVCVSLPLDCEFLEGKFQIFFFIIEI